MNKDERMRRVRWAAALADTTLSALATSLGVTRPALNYWATHGDPDPTKTDHQTRAARQRWPNRQPVTAARIAAVLGCPPEALHPGGPVPTWGEPSNGGTPEPPPSDALPRVALALGLDASATVDEVLDAVTRLASRAGDEGLGPYVDAVCEAGNPTDLHEAIKDLKQRRGR